MPEEATPIGDEKEPIQEEKPIVEKIPVLERRIIQFDVNVSPNYLKVIYGVYLRGNSVGTEAYFPKKHTAIKLNYADRETEKGTAFQLKSVILVNGITSDTFEINQEDIDNGRVSGGKEAPLTSLNAVIQFLLPQTAL